MLRHVLEYVKTVAIGGHIRPDGDCVGSCMGLYLYIKKNYPDIQTDVYLEDIPASFQVQIPACKEIIHEMPEDKTYDLFIALDCADLARLGFSRVLFEHAKKTFCVDHHVSNGSFADENYVVPEASSASELVYRLLDPEKMDVSVAECLFLGIVHDTGVFQYSCTSPETMEIAADLMRKQVRASEIISKTFYEKTYAQNQSLGRALLDSRLYCDGKVIASSLSRETMQEYRVSPKDLEGIVSQLRVTKGTEVAVFLYEIGPEEYKISLRASGDVDVNQVANTFGGGGHKKAAGLTMKGTVTEIIARLLAKIQEQL